MAYWQCLGELVHKWASQEETVNIHDATDDAREALEPASSPSEGERKEPRPGHFLAAFFGVLFNIILMLLLRCLCKLWEAAF